MPKKSGKRPDFTQVTYTYDEMNNYVQMAIKATVKHMGEHYKQVIKELEEKHRLEKKELSKNLQEFAPFTLSILLGADFDPTSKHFQNHLRKLKLNNEQKNAAMSRGREKANTTKKVKASDNDVTIEKAVYDYLNYAQSNGLDSKNKAIVAVLNKLQVKHSKGKQYTSETFSKKVALAAAKWRKENKLKK